MIGFLSIEVVMLTIQNRELKTTLANLTQSIVEPLKPGVRVESFIVQSLSGDTTEFTYSNTSSKYLLFILSTNCTHCEKNLVMWKKIVINKPDSVSVFGISLDNKDKTNLYVSSKDVSFYIASIADTSFTRKYKISGVPETILITGNGVVEKVWMGELNNENVNEIKS